MSGPESTPAYPRRRAAYDRGGIFWPTYVCPTGLKNYSIIRVYSCFTIRLVFYLGHRIVHRAFSFHFSYQNRVLGEADRAVELLLRARSLNHNPAVARISIAV